MDNYFTEAELKCPCCGACKMDQEFLDTLNRARQIAGIPFVINSGYRCQWHNREVGSDSTNHTSGKAVDIRENDAGRRDITVTALLRAGMTGIGIGKTFIHADTNHAQGTLWLYGEFCLTNRQ